MDGGMIAWTKSSTNERQSLTWRALDFEGREKQGHTGCTVHKRTTSRCIVVSAHHKRWFTMDMNKRCYSFHLFKLRLTRRERKETVERGRIGGWKKVKAFNLLHSKWCWSSVQSSQSQGETSNRALCSRCTLWPYHVTVTHTHTAT